MVFESYKLENHNFPELRSAFSFYGIGIIKYKQFW